MLRRLLDLPTRGASKSMNTALGLWYKLLHSQHKHHYLICADVDAVRAMMLSMLKAAEVLPFEPVVVVNHITHDGHALHFVTNEEYNQKKLHRRQGTVHTIR